MLSEHEGAECVELAEKDATNHVLFVIISVKRQAVSTTWIETSKPVRIGVPIAIGVTKTKVRISATPI